jgi:hypothetical protein
VYEVHGECEAPVDVAGVVAHKHRQHVRVVRRLHQLKLPDERTQDHTHMSYLTQMKGWDPFR